MASLALRMADKQAILKAIEVQQGSQAAETHTYAGVVKLSKPTSLPKPTLAATDTIKPTHDKPHLPNNSQDNTINGTSSQEQGNITNEAEKEKNPWILVSRRKPRGLKPKSKQQQRPRSKHITLLMEQNKCFKCLEQRHTQFQCRNGVTCLNCKGIGHIARMCTIKGSSSNKHKSSIHTTRLHAKPPQFTPTAQIHRHFIPQSNNMDLENWKTMPMQDHAEIVQARAAPLKIFFPPNDDLRSPNTLLHRSTVVLLGSNVRLSQMSFRIANSLATSLGRHPKEFTVSETDPSFGEYLVTFTSNMLRNMACYIGAFMVAPGVQVQLREWTPNLAIVRDPTTHKARIRLHGLPFTYWNFPHVNQLISEFGYAERMSQIVTNHNFKVL